MGQVRAPIRVERVCVPEHQRPTLLQSIRSSLKSQIQRGPIPLRLFQELRMEAHLFAVRLRAAADPRVRAAARQMRAARDVRLHFGCGPRILEGWLNIDGWRYPGIGYICDLRAALPLSDNSCRLIFSEHVLEHIDLQFVPAVVRELYRVLQPGGSLRIVVPDCGKFACAYAREDIGWFRTAVPGCESRAAGLNDIFRNHFHRFVYDFESLATVLRAGGFRQIAESSHQGSAIPDLRIDHDEPSRIIGNLYVEARK